MFPVEIYEIIFGYVDFDTILNLVTTCKLFRNIMNPKLLMNLDGIDDFIVRPYKSKYWLDLIKPVAIERGYVEIDDEPTFVKGCHLKSYQNIMLYSHWYYVDYNILNDFQTHKICLKIIKNYPCRLNCVKYQTSELCREAVRLNGLTIQYVKKQTHELCLVAIAQNGESLKYVKDQSWEICIAAIKINIDNIYYVREPSSELYLETIKIHGKLPYDMTFKVLEILLTKYIDDAKKN